MHLPIDCLDLYTVSSLTFLPISTCLHVFLYLRIDTFPRSCLLSHSHLHSSGIHVYTSSVVYLLTDLAYCAYLPLLPYLPFLGYLYTFILLCIDSIVRQRESTVTSFHTFTWFSCLQVFIFLLIYFGCACSL